MHAPHRGCLTRRCTCAAGGRDRPAPQVSHVAIDAPRPGLASGRAANVHGSASAPTNDSRGARPGITHPHTRGHMHAERAMPPCNLRGERPSNPLTTSDVANRPPLSRACRHSCSEWHCATCCAAVDAVDACWLLQGGNPSNPRRYRPAVSALIIGCTMLAVCPRQLCQFVFALPHCTFLFPRADVTELSNPRGGGQR